MVYQGYLAIGGEDGVGTTELINAQRAYAYARHVIPALPLDMPPENLAPDLPALLGHGEYSSPLADMAPWVDPDDPASTEFLGLFPTELRGFDDSTWHSDTVEFLGDGGVALGGRNEGREMRVKALMLASSEAGLQVGKTWLRNILSDAACRDAGIECGGEALITLASPPEACPELLTPVEPGQVHPCLAPFVRQYYRVTCTEGFQVRRQWWTECGPLIEVEFLLYAGVPQPHRLPEFIGVAQSDALATFTNLVENPSFEASVDGVVAGPYVDVSRDNGWAASGDYSLQLTPKRQDPRVRRNYVLNPSFETDLSDWAKGDPPALVSYAWTGTPDESPSTMSEGGVVAATNLVTNPRGRNTSGTVVVRENLYNPANLAGWSVTTTGTILQGSYDGYAFPVTPGEVYSFRRTLPLSSRFRFGFTDVTPADGVQTFDGSWDGAHDADEVVNGVVVPANATHMVLYLSNTQTGDVPLLIEKAPVAGEYFDGDTSPDTDLTPAWTGTAGASTSQLTAPKPVGWSVTTGSVVYYSASQDAVAAYQPDPEAVNLARYLMNIAEGDTGTLVMEAMTPQAGEVFVQPLVGAVDPVVYQASPGEWATQRAGWGPAIGDLTGVMQIYSQDVTTLYVRAASIDGTDSYTGPWFDGRVPDEAVADWTIARTNEGFSGDYSMLTTVTSPGAGVSYVADLATMSAPQRSTAFYVKVDAADPLIDGVKAEVSFLDSGGAEVGHRSATFSVAPSGWTRIALAAPANSTAATQLAISLRARSVANGEARVFQTGDTLIVDGVLAEASTLAGTYFDGDTPDEGGVTYAWDPSDGSSTATYDGAIISTRTYVDLTDGQDLAYGMEPGSSYHLQAVLHLSGAQGQSQGEDARTLQVVWTNYNGSEQVVRSAQAPNAAGDWPLSLDFEVPDNVSKGVVRLYSGGDRTSWWDAVLLSEGTPPQYFDGSTPDEDGWTYEWVDTTPYLAHAWTGPPGASTSTESVDGVVVRENLVPNPSFEYGMDGVIGYDATCIVTRSGETSWDGAYSARVDSTGGGNSLGITEDVNVPPGTWTLTARIYVPAASVASTDGTVRLRLGATPAVDVPVSIVASEWFEVSTTVTTTQTETLFWVSVNGAWSAGQWVYMDGVQIASDPGPYFDGDTEDIYQGASVARYNPIPPETISDVECDPTDVTVVLRRNLAPNPLPGNPTGWIPWPEKGNFTRSFVADDTLRAGGQSARVVRGSGNASVYCAYLRYVGYADVPSRPRVVAGERYTVSMYVKLDRTGKARMAVNVWNSSRNEIAEYRSTIPDLTQNGWARLSLTFTAPQGAASLGVHAWTYVTSSTNAPTGATSWFSQVLVERAASVGTYFDGNFTDTAELDYSWEGVPNRSPSIITQADTGDLLVDPDCEYVPPPPTPPAVVTDCIETPAEWTRYTVLVTNDNVPRWGSAVPVVTLSTGDVAARQVRIRFYPLNDPLDPLRYNECDYEMEFILTYLPPSTTMVIDGVRRQATASVGGNDPVSALHLLTGSGGAPYTWGTLTCDRDYAMTVDVAPLAEDVVVSLDLVGRE